MGTPLERKPSMDSIKTSSTVDHELQIGHVSGRHADSLVRNLEGDDFDLAEDQRLLREISCATTGLKDRFLKREGHNLLLEGNYLRNNMNKNSAGAKWPLCVPRVEVSPPGRTRVMQRRFNVSVPRAIVPEKAPTLRERSER